MATVKTAISIDRDLYDQIDRLAVERHSSRSSVLSEAARNYIELQNAVKLARSYNEFYKDYEPTEEDRQILEGIRRSAARVVAMTTDGDEW